MDNEKKVYTIDGFVQGVLFVQRLRRKMSYRNAGREVVMDNEKETVAISEYLHSLDVMQPLAHYMARGLSIELAKVVVTAKQVRVGRATGNGEKSMECSWCKETCDTTDLDESGNVKSRTVRYGVWSIPSASGVRRPCPGSGEPPYRLFVLDKNRED